MATEKRTVAVLGAGNIGGTLGRKWLAAGHQVVFGVSDPDGKNAQRLRSDPGDRAVIGTVADALSNNPEVVVIAVPGAVVDGIVTTYAQQLDGRILIDTANRMGNDTLHSFELIQQQTPHAQPFRAFNTYGWENFANTEFDDGPPDMFFCGADGEARTRVEQLITDIGLRPVYVGGIDKVSVVDGITQLWFSLVFGQQRGHHLAFKTLTH